MGDKSSEESAMGAFTSASINFAELQVLRSEKGGEGRRGNQKLNQTCKGVARRRRQDLKILTNTFRWNSIETTTFATILCHKFRRAVPIGVSCRVHGYKWVLGGKVDADEGRERLMG
jgi:hypothetical protein